MSIDDDLRGLLDDAYAELAVPAVWTPAGGGVSAAVLLLPDQADQTGGLTGFGRQVFARNVFRARVSELEIKVPGVDPAVGDGLQTIDGAGKPQGDPLKIVNPPLRKDARRMEWTLECG